MKIDGSTAIVTGAARGLGYGVVRGLLLRGARRVYALDRDLEDIEPIEVGLASRCVWVTCDVTSQEDVDRAAARFGDADLVVSNAGMSACQGLLAGASIDAAAREIEVNYLGALRVFRAFVPILRQRRPSAMLVVVSSLARAAIPALGSYCVSKAALLKAVEILRAELAPSGVHLLAALPGAIDTAMIRTLSIPKMTVDEAVAIMLDALEVGDAEVLVGDEAVQAEHAYRDDPAGFLSRGTVWRGPAESTDYVAG